MRIVICLVPLTHGQVELIQNQLSELLIEKICRQRLTTYPTERKLSKKWAPVPFSHLKTVLTPTCCVKSNNLEVVGVALPVGVALLQESIAALYRFVGHVGHAGRLTGKDLLAHHAVVRQIESELEHTNSLR